MVARDSSRAAPDARNGRANAKASSTSAAIAQREQQPLAQAAPSGVLHRRVPQQAHGRESQPRLRLTLEQVQHDRHRGGERADEKERRQEAHSVFDRVDRYASSASSSGSEVRGRRW